MPRTRTQRTKYVALAGLACFVTVVSGCAATLSSQAMVPESFQVRRQQSKPVAIHVSGGQETNPATGLPQVSNQAFADALETAIRSSRVFPQVVEGNQATYRLSVNLVSLQQPLMGGSFTVTLTAGWQLENLITGQVIWRKGVTSSHTVTMGESFWGTKRLKLATEGAARENIRQGLDMISQLEL